MNLRRSLLKMGLVVVACAGWSLCAQTEPDFVLFNGRVFTATDSRPYAEAIAVRGDKILAVDTTEKIRALAGPRTQRIDLAGRVVIPGIMDTHNHYFGAPLPTVTNFDLGEWAPSCKRVLEAVAQKIQSVPKGNLLFGSMGPDAFFDPQCTPAALDRIAPDTAVFLMSGTPHGGMLNRAAVKWFGVDTRLPPPLNGYYGKDMRSKTWDHHAAGEIYALCPRPGEGANFFSGIDGEDLVVGTTPANNATGVALNTVIKIQFSEPMDPTSFPDKLVIQLDATHSVTLTLTWNAAGDMLSLAPPSTGLPPGIYDIEIKGYTDTAGNPIATATLHFETVTS